MRFYFQKVIFSNKTYKNINTFSSYNRYIYDIWGVFPKTKLSIVKHARILL